MEFNQGYAQTRPVPLNNISKRLDVARFDFYAVRLHDSLIINILGENQVISYFLCMQ